ncbi:hypothetical protein ACQKNB_12930 [Lysinibacillus xylanilyticus]|uniref:hypothetical protein n=1 Tax=Lysinibacillus xylanilyticus TaxID=582475 RepID=UPI003D006D97
MWEILDTVRLIEMGLTPLYNEMRSTIGILEGVSNELFNIVVCDTPTKNKKATAGTVNNAN